MRQPNVIADEEEKLMIISCLLRLRMKISVPPWHLVELLVENMNCVVIGIVDLFFTNSK
jgi:hypothetical protein